jgi:hypothetical protein
VRHCYHLLVAVVLKALHFCQGVLAASVLSDLLVLIYGCLYFPFMYHCISWARVIECLTPSVYGLLDPQHTENTPDVINRAFLALCVSQANSMLPRELSEVAKIAGYKLWSNMRKTIEEAELASHSDSRSSSSSRQTRSVAAAAAASVSVYTPLVRAAVPRKADDGVEGRTLAGFVAGIAKRLPTAATSTTDSSATAVLSNTLLQLQVNSKCAVRKSTVSRVPQQQQQQQQQQLQTMQQQYQRSKTGGATSTANLLQQSELLRRESSDSTAEAVVDVDNAWQSRGVIHSNVESDTATANDELDEYHDDDEHGDVREEEQIEQNTEQQDTATDDPTLQGKIYSLVSAHKTVLVQATLTVSVYFLFQCE